MTLFAAPRRQAFVSDSDSEGIARFAWGVVAHLTWELPSVDVRWRPRLTVVIVTHLVTRLPAGFGWATWMQITGGFEDRTRSPVWYVRTRQMRPTSGVGTWASARRLPPRRRESPRRSPR